MSALADLTWTTMPERPIVLVPLGSFEQHGPHLPFDTDVVIAVEVAQRVAATLHAQAVVTPPLVFGSSGEHQSFTGTISVGQEALTHVLIEMVRSISNWSDRVIFVNAHGGNFIALAKAVAQMRYEGHDCSWAACATEDVDAHAGFTETSIMLHVDPSRVRLDLAAAGNTTPIGELLPAIIAGGISAVTDNGVLGDPAGASADEGARCLESMAADIAAAIVVNDIGSHGELRPVRDSVPA